MSESPGNLDEQQVQLVERLRAANGAAVTFEELRGIGIENPALLCYELAAVGMPITRTSPPGEGMPALSARLEPERDQPAADEEPPHHPRVAPAERPPPRRGQAPLKKLAAVAALLAAFGAVVAIVLGAFAHRRAPSGRPVVARVQHSQATSRRGGPLPAAPPRAPSSPGQTQPRHPAVTATTAAAPTRVSPAAAMALESEGHRLLLEGSYASAIPALASAVRASGQSLGGCSQPAGEACLTFAYALYDLGRALRLAGRHAEAISVLSDRLRIDNQRETVRHELDLARGARA
jgi:hypothetical protein